MRVLFLGGTGNISTACVEHALARGHQVGIMTRGQRPSPFGPWVEVLHGDRDDPSALGTAAGGAGTRSWTSSPTRRLRWTWP